MACVSPRRGAGPPPNMGSLDWPTSLITPRLASMLAAIDFGLLLLSTASVVHPYTAQLPSTRCCLSPLGRRIPSSLPQAMHVFRPRRPTAAPSSLSACAPRPVSCTHGVHACLPGVRERERARDSHMTPATCGPANALAGGAVAVISPPGLSLVSMTSTMDFPWWRQGPSR